MPGTRLLAALAALAAGTFVVLAVMLASGRLGPIDIELMFMVRQAASPPLDVAMLALSTIGGAPPVIALVVLCAAWAWWRRDRQAALAVLLVGITCEAVNQGLKAGFARARPELWPRPAMASFAFPSGHAMTSVAVFGMMAVVIARLAPRSRSFLWVAAPLWALGVGTSRVYLGVHWPSDVVAGYAAGLVLLILGTVGLRLVVRPLRGASSSM